MVEIPENVQGNLDALIKSIQESSIYNRYEQCRQEIEKSPELFAAMNQLRREDLDLSLHLEGEKGMEQEVRSKLLNHAAIHTNPVIGEYIDSELELCLMLRKILLEIGAVEDFHLDELSDLL